MSAFYTLPTSLIVDGEAHPIRSDYRAVLSILSVLQAPDIDQSAKGDWMGLLLYRDWDHIRNRTEALRQAAWFIDCGQSWGDENARQPRLMDWEQDWPLIAPACSRVAGRSIREMPYLHWWDFIGLYQEIGECAFSTVVAIRDKQARHKKLTQWEREYIRDHRAMVTLRTAGDDEMRSLIDRIRGGEELAG